MQAGKPVDDTIALLSSFMEPGDLLIDGGNEWYPNTLRRGAELAARELLFMGMGVSGGEEGARHGPSLMPGGPRAAYDMVKDVLELIAAKVSRAASSQQQQQRSSSSCSSARYLLCPPPPSRPTLAPASPTSASWAAATTSR